MLLKHFSTIAANALRWHLLWMTVCLAWFTSVSTSRADDRPNILWIVAEDLSPWIGSFGHEVNAGRTPAMDALGAQGVRFSRTFVPAPVCSPCRSAMITGPAGSPPMS